MAAQTIEIQSEVFGNPTPALAIQPVFVQVDIPHITVAELIRGAVAAQIANLLKLHNQDTQHVQQAIDLQYLSQADFVARRQTATQNTTPTRDKQRSIDVQAAQQRALRAFEQRAYLVLINGEQVDRLDDMVICAPQTRATFLRLLPLVGG